MELETIEQIADLFDGYAEKVFLPSSPLYAAIARGISQDHEVVQHLETVAQERILPVALMAAVHDLILEGAQHPLADYFLTRTPNPRPADDVYPHWREFFFEHQAAILWRVQHRRVQTNEIRRSACLMPAFAQIFERTHQPLAMIEVGCSAGLTMLWDRLRYDYDGRQVGPEDASLTLHTAVRGTPPPLPQTWPAVKARVGFDLNPLDGTDPADARWLQALIWPEQVERRARLQAGLALLQQHRPRIVQGDVLEVLPELIESMPLEATLVVYHSYVLVQLPPELREQVYEHLRRAAQTRPIYHLALEWYNSSDRPELWLHFYHQNEAHHTRLAICEQHGGWITWVDED